MARLHFATVQLAQRFLFASVKSIIAFQILASITETVHKIALVLVIDVLVFPASLEPDVKRPLLVEAY